MALGLAGLGAWAAVGPAPGCGRASASAALRGTRRPSPVSFGAGSAGSKNEQRLPAT